jgi:hypothetical protein
VIEALACICSFQRRPSLATELADSDADPVSDDFERLDRLLRQLVQVLEVPGEDGEVSAELSWQKLDLLYESMGSDALGALLRRQGMSRSSTDEALAVLSNRRQMMP